MTDDADHAFLLHATRIGARGLGRTFPNPSVGCVLVKNGHVIATATTADRGHPHAETLAIAAAEGMARGATAYVSLEPCAHEGKTLPCATALIEAGIARVVVASIDPNPKVNGGGIAMLRAAGIDVRIIPLQEAATAHRGFFRHIRHGLPYVAMKLATSADYYMAHAGGSPRWLTGEAARRHAHGVRGRMDAVLTGIGTVLADNPQLTCRLPGVEHPCLVRVVADRNLRLPRDCLLVQSASCQPTWVITHAAAVKANASHANELREQGVEFLVIEDVDLHPNHILAALGARGITRLLVEAGPKLSSAFMTAGCVDTLYWYHAPMMLGNAGAFAFPRLDITARETRRIALQADNCEISEMVSCLPD